MMRLVHAAVHRRDGCVVCLRAIARQTAAAKPGDFLRRFEERLQALATSYDVLVKSGWKGVDLSDLVRFQLAHFHDLVDNRIELDGPSICISAPAAQTIGMAVHELATNAGKYGALSNGTGRVQIDVRQESGEEGFRMSWRESGGPFVAAPAHSGFGSTVITGLVRSGLDAEVELNHQTAGVSWRLRCPAEDVTQKSL
ncbi:MAG: sensor histidine kinase [Rhodomicrobium sp.]